MESADSSTSSQHPNLPPGFRFHPTDEELVVHYLKKKLASAPLPVAIIAEVDLYKFDPWELPSKATFGKQEWYFFSPRDRKYPNGARPNRAATSGYWKATGTDKPILTSNGNQKVGVKKALVFYGGKPPKGVKTNWIMHEYRLIDNNNRNPHASDLPNKKNSLRLDDWVLCRIYKKNNAQRAMEDCMEGMYGTQLSSSSHQNQRKIGGYGSFRVHEESFFDGILSAVDQGTIQQTMGGTINVSPPNSNTSNTVLVSLKRTANIPPQQYWNNETAAATNGSIGSSPGKRFHGNLNGGSTADNNNNSTADDDDDDHNHTNINNNSFVSLLSQVPQSESFHRNNFLLGDGSLRSQFQLPSMNWNS